MFRERRDQEKLRRSNTNGRNHLYFLVENGNNRFYGILLCMCLYIFIRAYMYVCLFKLEVDFRYCVGLVLSVNLTQSKIT